MRTERSWTIARIVLVVVAAVLMRMWAVGRLSSRVGAQAQVGEQNAALACYQHAVKQTLLSDGNAFLLCRNARSIGPVQCYDAGTKQTGLASSQLFALCRCADSPAPVQCYIRAHRDTFLLDQQIIALCSARVTNNLWPNCTPIAR